jgi:hypothetical protein
MLIVARLGDVEDWFLMSAGAPVAGEDAAG